MIRLIKYVVFCSCLAASAAGGGQKTAEKNSPVVASPLPFGEVMPEGWLLEQMRQDLKEGITGQFPSVNKTTEKRLFVRHNARPDNVPHLKDDANVRGWWSGEHEGYYNDGYFRSSWLAGDENNKKKAIQRLDDILAAADDGYIGIYSRESRLPDSGPDGELWAQSRLFQALLAYYEASNDKKILHAVERAVKMTMVKRGIFPGPNQRMGEYLMESVILIRWNGSID